LIKVDAGRYGYARYPIHNSYLGITHYPPIYYNEENKKQWHYIEETFKEMERAGKVVYYKTHEEYKGEYSFYIKKYQKDVAKQSKNISTLFAVDNKYTNSNGTRDIARLFGEIGVSFPYPKPSSLMEKIFGHLSICGLTICDHFAGSGTTAHATINLNREDNGHRKYILVEMGEYFDTVMKPRIQKVIYSADWKDGKPVSRKGSSHAFKYIRLESYDDTLDNLEFKSPQIEMTEPIREEYLLSYMLDIESRDSLFSVDKFSKPFSYSMKINGETRNIDLVETFNYLIGLKVDKNYAMKRFDAEFTSEGEYLSVIAKLKNGSTYKIKMVSGTTRDGEKVLVIWRELTGDINKDSAILEAFFKDIQRDKYQKIYVNGDNNLLKLRTDQENWNVMLIEEEFKKRMFEEVK
jgi:adenine-specific DNA-methyltransferase